MYVLFFLCPASCCPATITQPPSLSLLLLSDLPGLPESIPAVCGRRRGHTLDKLPVHCRATNSQTRLLHPSSRAASTKQKTKKLHSNEWHAGRVSDLLNWRRPFGLSPDQRRRLPTELLHLHITAANF